MKTTWLLLLCISWVALCLGVDSNHDSNLLEVGAQKAYHHARHRGRVHHRSGSGSGGAASEGGDEEGGHNGYGTQFVVSQYPTPGEFAQQYGGITGEGAGVNAGLGLGVVAEAANPLADPDTVAAAAVLAGGDPEAEAHILAGVQENAIAAEAAAAQAMAASGQLGATGPTAIGEDPEEEALGDSPELDEPDVPGFGTEGAKGGFGPIMVGPAGGEVEPAGEDIPPPSDFPALIEQEAILSQSSSRKSKNVKADPTAGPVAIGEDPEEEALGDTPELDEPDVVGLGTEGAKGGFGPIMVGPPNAIVEPAGDDIPEPSSFPALQQQQSSSSASASLLEEGSTASQQTHQQRYKEMQERYEKAYQEAYDAAYGPAYSAEMKRLIDEADNTQQASSFLQETAHARFAQYPIRIPHIMSAVPTPLPYGRPVYTDEPVPNMYKAISPQLVEYLSQGEHLSPFPQVTNRLDDRPQV